MIRKIRSGGQTSEDRAALDVAIKLGIPYGGWIPKGRITEEGPLPEKYQMQEMPMERFAARTEQNVIDSDGTLITDRYGRSLAVVFVDGKNVNLETIKAGLAEVYRGPPAKGLDFDPNWKAEEEAREAKRNMWSLSDKYISPRQWRRQQRN